MRPFTVSVKYWRMTHCFPYPVIELLIDRLVVSDDKTLKSRLADSAETAFFEGARYCIIRIYIRRNGCKRIFQEIRGRWYGVRGTDRYDVQFNNPLGACPTCEGFGKVLGIDEKCRAG